MKVTLSASNEKTWTAVHRQAAGIAFPEILEGLRAFREIFNGELWLEVMLLDGINSSEEEVMRIADISRAIRPERVQLNTPVRPPAETHALPVAKAELDRLALLFDPPAEVIVSSGGKADDAKGPEGGQASDEDVLGLLRRHPCSAADIAGALGAERERILAILHRLEEQGQVETRGNAGDVCYLWKA